MNFRVGFDMVNEKGNQKKLLNVSGISINMEERIPVKSPTHGPLSYVF